MGVEQELVVVVVSQVFWIFPLQLHVRCALTILDIELLIDYSDLIVLHPLITLTIIVKPMVQRMFATYSYCLAIPSFFFSIIQSADQSVRHRTLPKV